MIGCQLAKDRLASVQRDYDSVDARFQDAVKKHRASLESAEAAAAHSSALEKENYRLDNLCSDIRRRWESESACHLFCFGPSPG